MKLNLSNMRLFHTKLKNDHIKVKIFGGLGNQMYQYAMARTLADKFSLGLTLDISSYHGNKRSGIERSFSLDKFNIRYTSLEASSGKKYWSIAAAKQSIYLQNLFGIYLENDLPISELSPSEIKGQLLVGYWQNYRYFEDNSENILSDFSLKHSLSKRSEELLSNVSQGPSLMVHIRRGDYVTSSESGGQHRLVPLSYYKAALKIISNTLVPIKIFVFSDDIEWCKNLAVFEGFETHFVGQSKDRGDYEDLHAMACCDRHIIANSTFSWWAAWMASQRKCKEQPYVCAPKTWFYEKTGSSTNVMLKGWTCL